MRGSTFVGHTRQDLRGASNAMNPRLSQSFCVAVDSPEAVAIKQDLAARIGDSSYFLCIVGTETYRSGWAAWEIHVPHRSREVTEMVLAVDGERWSFPLARSRSAKGYVWARKYSTR